MKKPYTGIAHYYITKYHDMALLTVFIIAVIVIVADAHLKTGFIF